MKLYKCCCSLEQIPKDNAFRFVLSPDNRVCLDLNFDLRGKDFIVSREESLIPIWNNQAFFEEKFGVKVDIESIRQHILKEFHYRILTFIALAKKSGKVQLGKMQVEGALRNANDNCAIIQATDASQRERFKPSSRYSLLEVFTSDELSSFLGKEKLYYIFLEGNFVPLILNLAETYKILKEYK